MIIRQRSPNLSVAFKATLVYIETLSQKGQGIKKNNNNTDLIPSPFCDTSQMYKHIHILIYTYIYIQHTDTAPIRMG